MFFRMLDRNVKYLKKNVAKRLDLILFLEINVYIPDVNFH